MAYIENLKNISELSDSALVLQLYYDGYALKLPVFMCNQGDNYKGKFLSLGLVTAANLLAYGGLKYYNSKKALPVEKKYKIDFGHYD